MSEWGTAVFTTLILLCRLIESEAFLTTSHATCEEPIPSAASQYYSPRYAWSAWHDWSPDQLSCPGPSVQQTRHRACLDLHYHGHVVPTSHCTGSHAPDTQTRRCTPVCGPIVTEPGWSTWQPWGACSRTCGNGTRERHRVCDNPPPKPGELLCIGPLISTSSCRLASCPVIEWSAWSAWTICGVTCGNGTSVRVRHCGTTQETCVGPAHQTTQCHNGPWTCPTGAVNGSWSSWSDWTPCSTTCGTGMKSRQRSCDNPEPTNGGATCVGNATMTDTCQSTPCAGDAWSAWTAWTACNATCGSGSTVRIRHCNNDQSECTGEPFQTKSCVSATCPPAEWAAWSEWTGCSATCGNGTSIRVRQCNTNNTACTGEAFQTKPCTSTSCAPAKVDGGWGEWGPWTTCTDSCGLGIKMRNRACDNPEPTIDGMPCMGTFSSTTTCQIAECNTASTTVALSTWSDWTNWSACDVTCGNGMETRTRACSSGGASPPCDGTSSDSRPCKRPSCPAAGVVGRDIHV